MSSTFSTVSQGKFFVGSPQDEALARLHYLSDRRRRLGLVHGAHGAGKTWALQRYAHEARRRGHDVVLLDLAGRDGREFLHQLADDLGARVGRQEARFQLWRGILNRLFENQSLNVLTVLVFDHVDEATDEVRGLLLRLLHAADEPSGGITTVLATTEMGPQGLDVRLRERVDLRIELEPWTTEDIERYLCWRADQMSSSTSNRRGSSLKWNADAAAALWRATSGLPRTVARLVDLTCVAATEGNLGPISAEAIELVRSELVLH